MTDQSDAGVEVYLEGRGALDGPRGPARPLLCGHEGGEASIVGFVHRPPLAVAPPRQLRGAQH
eukprot:1194266-Prorocentrum_minimum.AAC.1